MDTVALAHGNVPALKHQPRLPRSLINYRDRRVKRFGTVRGLYILWAYSRVVEKVNGSFRIGSCGYWTASFGYRNDPHPVDPIIGAATNGVLLVRSDRRRAGMLRWISGISRGGLRR
jgi:hypothetical protein